MHIRPLTLRFFVYTLILRCILIPLENKSFDRERDPWSCVKDLIYELVAKLTSKLLSGIMEFGLRIVKGDWRK